MNRRASAPTLYPGLGGRGFCSVFGAGEGIRTLDVFLGKEALCH